MGYLPSALRNYLLRLGWGHGDAEIIPTGKAIEWFDIDDVGRAASRFDFAKLTNLNAHYLRETPDTELLALVRPLIEKTLGTALSPGALERIARGMNGVKQRTRTVVELAAGLVFYARDGAPPMDEKAQGLITAEARRLLAQVVTALEPASVDWTESMLEATVKAVAESAMVKLGQVAQPLRAALTGSTVSPGIFEVLAILGRDESLARLRAAA
jgi:glutamyl-tRNA synthetase